MKRFSDGSFLEYDEGSFDRWCVYLTRPGGPTKLAVKDAQYFKALRRDSALFGAERLYADFVTVYDMVDETFREPDMERITALTRKYGERDPGKAVDLDIIFSILYMGMVAEERKEHAVLKKRVKRLGVYQVLMLGMDPEEAAGFSRGKPWRELNELCAQYGFGLER